VTVCTVKTPKVSVLSQIDYQGPKKRVGLLGGTFNPPHLGHLVMADQVLNQLNLDKVYLMPNNLPPHVDEKKTIAADKRLKMVQLSVADHPKLDVEMIELKRGGVSYSYDTIKELKMMHPENDYYFIIGGDMVEYLPKWYRIDELVKMVQFVAINREGYQKVSKYPLLWVDVPTIGISSSLIRQKVAQGASIKYLVKDSVEKYIEKEGLYRE